MEEKSIEQIVSIINKKIVMTLIQELPTPTCKLKKQRNDWKIQEVKKKLSEILNSNDKG
jgi:hypothetical protein